MPPKKSNLNNARSRGARRKRVERAHLLAEQNAIMEDPLAVLNDDVMIKEEPLTVLSEEVMIKEEPLDETFHNEEQKQLMEISVVSSINVSQRFDPSCYLRRKFSSDYYVMFRQLRELYRGMKRQDLVYKKILYTHMFKIDKETNPIKKKLLIKIRDYLITGERTKRKRKLAKILAETLQSDT